MSESVICSVGHTPTTMPKIGSNEINDTSNHPLASAIWRIPVIFRSRAICINRRIVAAIRPQSEHAMNCVIRGGQA